MAALRTPVTGCPWDLEQTFETIAPYTLEEAYEVADAIARGDLVDLREELGDLLLQVVYHSRIAEEAGAFSFRGRGGRDHAQDDPAASARFRNARRAGGGCAAGILGAHQGGGEGRGRQPNALRAGVVDAGKAQPSLLDDVPAAMPALVRAVKLQDKAAKVGFDWPSLAPVFDKMREELAELEEVALRADPRGSERWWRWQADGRRSKKSSATCCS